jgi:hypothetical protein
LPTKLAQTHVDLNHQDFLSLSLSFEGSKVGRWKLIFTAQLGAVIIRYLWIAQALKPAAQWCCSRRLRGLFVANTKAILHEMCSGGNALMKNAFIDPLVSLGLFSFDIGLRNPSKAFLTSQKAQKSKLLSVAIQVARERSKSGIDLEYDSLSIQIPLIP